MQTNLESKLYAADFWGYEQQLTDAERTVLQRLRRFLEEEAAPVINDYWERGETPLHLREGLAGLDLVDPAELRAAGESPRGLFVGFRNYELSRTDSSLGILFGGQAGMFRTVVCDGGSSEQVEQWDEAIKDFSMTGCFALTEPDHGSDVARGLETTARFENGTWMLNGAKRWIGNAALSEYMAVVAKDVADGQAKIFLARTDDPGVRLTKIAGKTSVRMVNNSNIELTDVPVPDAYRLKRVNSFDDINRIFRTLRPDVVWNAAGLQAGVYEAALAYAKQREQFGKPIASFQLIQEKLTRMLGNAAASLSVAVRITELQERGECRDEDAALAKMWVCDRMRETVALGREIGGGNGIVLDYNLARFFADAESLYTFEGTREVNALIVGRAITGISAFV
ncbi:acyl-CoA dehydrogenase family protein [Enteractinococcus helveticum]|uniref:Glutaryl-CoA dehydrogenase n=1 Tax=Enteractinococcus helveticum TaxID=1837282 RepID=A0A1B7M2J4_9MICC|nr:acyl-CoA dehydrogenase family protein [Enteractinococcus helveticum]OAV62759.1 glutaryl-CoA dehydrogenase [Enteractinococcus helveticum]